jgi:hypothetical protein
MNIERIRERVWLAYLVGILGAFLIVGLLIYGMYRFTRPPALDAERAAARAKALAEIRGLDKEALETSAWTDKGKGFVRLRIDDAMKIIEREWKNPGAAHSNLVARVEKATAPPPKPPEQPSPFE